MTSLAAYIADAHLKAKKPNADIRERWQTRIVARNLHHQGMAGADSYLRDYGRGISAAKVIALALLAEIEGCQAMANGFWVAAHRLEGHAATPAEVAAVSGAVPAAPQPEPQQEVQADLPAGFAELPQHLQPGRVVTQQPVDAVHDRSRYIADPSYGGQPKRDGNRIVVTATMTAVAYQSRSMRLRPSPSAELDAAFSAAARQLGSCILDGELVFIDAMGMEHRTGAQAAEANALHGQAAGAVICQVSVFKALYHGGCDLTSSTERERIAHGAACVAVACGHLRSHATGQVAVEAVPTAWSLSEKQALADLQRREGREGEVWFRADAPYRGGKHVDDLEEIVRTKYISETVVTVMALTPSTVAGRPFAAIEVGEMGGDGRLIPIGAVGSGFTAQEARAIAEACTATPGQVRIVVRHQGRTEGGKLWHARFDSIAA